MASTLLPRASRRAFPAASHLSHMLSHHPLTQLRFSLWRTPTSIALSSAPVFQRCLTSTTSSTQDSTATTSSEFAPLPYFVHRTASQELPVYHLAKRGGNLHQTRIRKVDGDRTTLRNELQQALDVKAENIRVNQITGHLIIKGWFKAEVKRFLEGKHL